MKKIIFTIVLAGFISVSAFAQISFGVKGGLNLSKVKAEEENVTIKSDNRLSFNLGGFLVKSFSEKLALQPEFVISSEGGKVEDTEDLGGGDSYSFKSTLKYTFINIPILLRYTVVENLNLYAGPQIGINFGAKIEEEGTLKLNGVTETETTEGDIEDVASIGLAFGIGAGYYVTENIEIGIRYNAGLSNWDTSDSDYTEKHNTIQIGVAYKIK